MAYRLFWYWLKKLCDCCINKKLLLWRHIYLYTIENNTAYIEAAYRKFIGSKSFETLRLYTRLFKFEFDHY